MADRAITALPAATTMSGEDLFAISQNGQAKKVSWTTFYQYLQQTTWAHGGIQSIGYTPPEEGSISGTVTITFGDNETTTFTLPVGRGISSITGPSASGLTDTYTIHYNDGTTSTFPVNNGRGINTITTMYATSASGTDAPDDSAFSSTRPTLNPTSAKWLWMYQHIVFNDDSEIDTAKSVVGVYGDTGQDWHVHIKYAETEPTSNADMSDSPDNWIGVYSGTSETAPTDYTAYTWFKYKGEQGASIDKVKYIGRSGLTDTYRIFFSDSSVSPFDFFVQNGTRIASITGPSTSGLYDTYTITMNDGTDDTEATTFPFTVKNGAQIASVKKTSTSGLKDTYTITMNDGTATENASTFTFDVTNGMGITEVVPADVTDQSGHENKYLMRFNNGDSVEIKVRNGVDGIGSVSKVDGISPDSSFDVPLLIFGQEAPTTATQGILKQRYFDQANSTLYICVGVNTSEAGTTYSWQGAGVTVDSFLSTMTTNPVQNKVITKKVGTAELATTADDLSSAINEHEDDINGITSTIGTAAMGTTATTVKGAIAEHEDDINGTGGLASRMATAEQDIVTLQSYEAVHISVASFSSFPKTISGTADAPITADMRVINCVFSNPSAITSDVKWTTADGTTNGTLTLSGSISGSTEAEIDLIRTN